VEKKKKKKELSNFGSVNFGYGKRRHSSKCFITRRQRKLKISCKSIFNPGRWTTAKNQLRVPAFCSLNTSGRRPIVPQEGFGRDMGEDRETH